MATQGSPVPATTYGPSPRTFKLVAYVEAVTYLVLLAGVVNHRVLGGADSASVLGPIHGIVYLLFLVLALKLRPDQGWSLGRTLWILVLASLPFGGFLVARDVREEPA